MAGNYPDVPDNRMAYDRDGTQVFKVDSTNNVTQLTSGEIATLNDESNTVYPASGAFHGSGTGSYYLVVFFPELRNLAGYFLATGYRSSAFLNHRIEVSTNTTNGIDGTWTQLGTDLLAETSENLIPVAPTYRSRIISATALGIRAVRYRADRSSASSTTVDNIAALHLYGRIASGQNPNRLAIWHPTLDARITGAYYDWGNTARSSSADRSFRVKNMSSTLTAEDITVAFDILTDTTPPVPGQYTVSDDGGANFYATVDITSLAPGGLSPVLIVRRNTPANADLSVWAPRLLADAGSWS